MGLIQLEPAAVAIFAAMLDRDNNFRNVVPLSNMQLYFTREGGSALATFYASGHILLTTSVLLSGADPPQEEQRVLSHAQDMLYSLAVTAGARSVQTDLLTITARPVIASVVIGSLEAIHDLHVAADMETCLAAAFFENVLGEKT